MGKKKQAFKIGFYIRVSTEEQAQNIEGSIRNQEERLKSHVEFKNSHGHFGEIKEVFIDRARSGKDTNRPELQKLLEAIRQGEINFVMATELSRISRSIKDFAEIWDLMQSHGCGFQSLRENFDTTTAAGELVLFSMANLAQFERRQVSERVALNMNARAKRGLYNGGVVPFGYKLIADKPGYLDVDKNQSKIVQRAFQVFLKEESLSKTAKWLNENGYKMERFTSGGGKFRLDFFTVENLHHILRNKVYVGVRTYKDKDDEIEVDAVWPAIVERDLFDRVQKMLTQNKSRRKTSYPKRHPYLLSGITFCEICGDHLSGKSAHGKKRKIPYYEHSWRTKRGSTLTQKSFDCGNHRRFLADKLEKIVLAEVEKLVTNAPLVRKLLLQAQLVHKQSSSTKELESLKAKLYSYNSQLDALAERLSQLPKSVSAKPIFKQMERIEALKAETSGKIERLRGTDSGRQAEPPIELSEYRKFLASLKDLLRGDDQAIKAKIIKRLIHRIEVGKESVTISYKADKPSLLREPLDLGSRFFLCQKSGKVLEFPNKKGGQDSCPAASDFSLNFSSVRCSKSLTNGSEGGT
ncbi:MAG: recombinase family protein [Bdellovibrionaceae bacterium]|nr:recombinase family protein [Pseudobdellovibrionaceae bacterium]